MPYKKFGKTEKVRSFFTLAILLILLVLFFVFPGILVGQSSLGWEDILGVKRSPVTGSVVENMPVNFTNLIVLGFVIVVLVIAIIYVLRNMFGGGGELNQYNKTQEEEIRPSQNR